jgi:hypothetical protein
MLKPLLVRVVPKAVEQTDTQLGVVDLILARQFAGHRIQELKMVLQILLRLIHRVH